ncbi:MAG TPA: transcription-repair coupling factor [Oscillospiraceae bacterium]|nr:transcription-repair coupling factor [Oscillospiraceae bacterium]HPS75848.1 transcription-repair coupling factor [Oscillospiraceae bacterium]
MNICVQEILRNREIAALPSLLESGGLPALISGLSSIHRANLAAALQERLDRPLVVLCPDEAAAESMAGDLSAMLKIPVTVVGGRDFTFYSTVAASRQTEQKRLQALAALAGREATAAVFSAAGLLQRTLPPETLLSAGTTLREGGSCPIEDVEDALARCGYQRAGQVEGPGQFARRGGILDFFSPAYDKPVRIEFWGDEIDSMGLFDTASQRRVEALDRCRILPAAETLVSLCQGGRGSLAARLGEYAEKCEKKKTSPQAQALAKTLREDGEKLGGGAQLSDADRYLPLIYPFACGLDYLPEDAFIVLSEPVRTADRAKAWIRQTAEDVKELNRRGVVAASPDSFYQGWDEACRAMTEFPLFMADAFTVGRYPVEPKTMLSIQAKQLPSYGGSAQTAAEDVRAYLRQDYAVTVLAGDLRRAGVLKGFFESHGLQAPVIEPLTERPRAGTCVITTGALSAGMEFPLLKSVLLTDSQLVRVRESAAGRKKKLPGNQQKLTSYTDLTVGDLVVHERHGIGRFSGIVKMTVDGFEKDYMKISYAGTDCLYVPCTQLDLVSKYIGAGGEDRPVKLSKMGGAEWARSRSRAKAAAKDLAKGLLQLYAERQRVPGHAFSPDSEWQRQFEENFSYTETDDQLRSVAEIKADMEKSAPMDRLLCGDVGYGKTEVALRAVMKCLLDGRQAALLCPTTVLARQHFQTAEQRFFGFPTNIALLSRYQTGAELKKALEDIQSGKCDLVIGTHRLLQKDVKFKNLGLLVVDEEQRFGVTHKEHIKELSRGVDVLTLSATPIPRTLNMALSGIRDMSTIEEPPQDRMPVQTFVMEHDWGVLSDAIRRELQRGGQVYYLHNRIDNIEKTARKLHELLGDDVTIAVAHGRMDREALSSVMESVSEGRTQILVCTTIIETGIDIPNVNTLVIEDADRMGLAQLHQIRGRVGRSTRRASAYLTFRPDKVLSEIQEKRLSAIREFAEFGSGFKIAMRDLEIRGAGNLLGAEQSGHMIDVGYEMYLKLLEEAVLEEKGEKPEARCECDADLAVAANIPDRYVPGQEQRMDLYRRIALIRTEEEADDLTDELIDRFGDPPGSVNTLIQVALLRGEAGRAGITDITQKAGYLRFTVRDFDMEKVSVLYAQPQYKGRLKVEAGSRPCLSLRLGAKARVIEEARRFTADWGA